MNEVKQSWLTRALIRLRGTLPFAWGVIAALLAVSLYNVLFPADVMNRREVAEAISSALASATPRPAFSAQAYSVIAPSLVGIQTDQPNAESAKGHAFGSGVIVNDLGEILTSLHVVANASNITLFFADGTQSSATITLTQPEIDIAVLQPAALPREWRPAILGNPGAMRVGDEAFVIGNPFGLPWSFSAGVISGFNRTFRAPNSDTAIEGMIQFDAAANPGNSGGPLLDRNGRVIGIVTGILNPTDTSFFVGIGFAVPIGTATSGMNAPSY
ncbi:MAG: hypothetical protein B6D38_07510 [Anaerolineae bacterium UTCFX1]|jgi:S1-C subfamily serine protease|nr:MAG: hypothetical protein B6D38_07510 [Anaerolineae bacterium UTCFX1]